MALRTNRLNAQGYVGGFAAGGAQAWSVTKLHLLRNLYVDNNSTVSDKSGVPNGYNMGVLLLPLKPGGLSSYTGNQTSITATPAILAAGRNLSGSATTTITAGTINLDQIVPLTASSTTSITAGTVTLAAAVSGTASSTTAITTAASTLGGIFNTSASSSSAITPAVTLTALAFITAEAGGPTPLSPEGLAQAVWNANLSDFNNAGSTGEALANASSAGNPWDALVADNSDPGTFGEYVGKKVLTTSKFLGLK